MMIIAALAVATNLATGPKMTFSLLTRPMAVTTPALQRLPPGHGPEIRRPPLRRLPPGKGQQRR